MLALGRQQHLLRERDTVVFRIHPEICNRRAPLDDEIHLQTLFVVEIRQRSTPDDLFPASLHNPDLADAQTDGVASR
ncbi:MAG: hypothetical protein GY820_22395 [Gammaproteobacteria bacterium]|nr:hypothetical protein [Gammaproteobacteria bacterium]